MPYKPPENPPMVLVGTDPIILPEYVARWVFLDALQMECPQFWDGLYALRDGRASDVTRWLSRWGVTDEWLIEIAWDTIWYWARRGAQAASTPRFHYELLEGCHVQWPLFDPRLTLPFPLVKDGRVETPQECAARIKAQFDEQLRQYTSYLQAVCGDDHTEMRQHAQWTAMVFAGQSYTRVAASFRHLKLCDQPDATVKMAVHRFSRRIGLTVARRRRRKS